MECFSGTRFVRLVVYSRSGFFYDKGHPRGMAYEALEEFQQFVNKKRNSGALKVQVKFLPIKPEQLEAALTQGVWLRIG